jgi:hypothetical protein
MKVGVFDTDGNSFLGGSELFVQLADEETTNFKFEGVTFLP